MRVTLRAQALCEDSLRNDRMSEADAVNTTVTLHSPQWARRPWAHGHTNR